MCVSQFRDYCKAYSFRHENREEALNDKFLKVRKGTWHYRGRSYYYATDLEELRKLAKQGNKYAIAELAELNK